ncbi:MAG: glycosyltransferase family 4 protein [Gammaproteobacteria bacterium]|nr:glycosyltransferase family 4 protein [Gammaproteobacteria bacterium]
MQANHARVIDAPDRGQAEAVAPVSAASARLKLHHRPLRLLILSPHYPPDLASTGQLVEELAEDLAAAGHEPIVIASRPGYADEERPPYSLLTTERRNGVTIHWLGIPNYGRRGLWTRLLPFAGYLFGAALRGLFIRNVDVVFAQSTPPLLAGLLARLLSLGSRRQFVYNLQDVYPELGQALGVLGDGPLLRATAWVERRLRRSADVLAVISDDMRARCLDADPALANIVVQNNWADAEAVFPVAPADNAFLRQHGLRGKFVVMYSGNLGRAHDCEILPQIAAGVADLDDIELVIIGAGPGKAIVEDEVARQQLRNVTLLPYQDKSRLHESLSAADVAIVLQREPTRGLVVPSKVYGVMASGRATIAAVPADSEVADVVVNENAGIVVAPGDTDAVIAAIRQLHADRDRCRRYGRNGRAAIVERYDRTHAATAYESLFTRIATPPRTRSSSTSRATSP